MENKYINALVDFIKNNDNWYELLKNEPYNLKSIKECVWHSNWYMFNYNLFNSELTNDVVRGCRGTILEINGKDVKVISAPYTKFFNYGDEKNIDIQNSINWKNACVVEKWDGILIKTASIVDTEKRLYFFTNGSFDLNAPFEDSLVYDEPETRGAKVYGDLLKYALSKVIKDKIVFNEEAGYFYCCGEFANSIPVGATIMLELVSPRNKIICEYNETKIIIHGYRNENGIEENPRMIKSLNGFEFPKLYAVDNYEAIQNIFKTFKGTEHEGVVVVDYSTKDTPRVKIKCDDYLKMKFAQDVSCNTQILFKAVVDNEYDDLIASVPAVIPKIEEIKLNISKVEKWFFEEGLRLSISSYENKKDWVSIVKETTKPSLFSYYMDMYSPMSMLKFEKRLRNLSVKKHGYEEILNLIKEIEN